MKRNNVMLFIAALVIIVGATIYFLTRDEPEVETGWFENGKFTTELKGS